MLAYSSIGYQEHSSMQRFEGRVAIVTGGGSGLGQATAAAFAREGARVAVIDWQHDSAARTVAMIKDKGGEATAIIADVTEPEQIQRAIKQTTEIYGRLDVAFNNAGFARGSGIVDTSEDDWDATHDLNLKGVWLCMKYEIPEMLKVGGGAIVNTSSVSALRHFSGNNPSYVTSKYGQLALTRYAAVEYAERGIRVNSVLPGIIETPLSRTAVTVDLQRAADRYHPMKCTSPDPI
jgi:NAD(P)-dependent dehydrogenase (short-subunit alcohol dehydrogenase family)